MAISAQILEDLKTAMKARDTVALTVLRGLKSAAKYAAIEEGGADAELDEAGWVAVIRKELKKRQDAIEGAEKANRNDLIEAEKAEVVVLEKYLPAAPSTDEVESMVSATIEELGATSRADMGKVIKAIQEKTAGAVDNRTLSQIVGKALG